MYVHLSLIDLLSLDSRHKFQDVKTKGVGQTTILKFLEGSYTQPDIQTALGVLNNESISQEAIEILGNINDVAVVTSVFKKVAKERGEDIPKEEQIEIVKKVEKRISDKKKTKGNGGMGLTGSDAQKSLRLMVLQETTGEDEFDLEIKDLEIDMEKICKSARTLDKQIGLINTKLDKLEINKIEGLAAKLTMQNFTELGLSIKIMVEYFGININLKQIENES